MKVGPNIEYKLSLRREEVQIEIKFVLAARIRPLPKVPTCTPKNLPACVLCNEKVRKCPALIMDKQYDYRKTNFMSFL